MTVTYSAIRFNDLKGNFEFILGPFYIMLTCLNPNDSVSLHISNISPAHYIYVIDKAQ